MTNMTLQEKKVDAKELAEMLNKLPEEEKVKLFYVIKGAVLVSGNGNKDKNSA